LPGLGNINADITVHANDDIDSVQVEALTEMKIAQRRY
jgi:hypothetical protein